MTTKARQLAEFIANADVDSDEIATGAVSASKLAATLDLSSKTISMPDVAAFNITSGDVGIGTANPAEKFHIASSSGNTILNLQRTNTNTTGTVGALTFTASDGHVVAAVNALGDGNDDGANLQFRTTSAASGTNYYNDTDPRMTILGSNGNVGIGNATPENALHVSSEDNAQLLVQNTSTGDASIKFNRSGQTFFMGIESSDNSFRISDTGTGVGDGDRLIIDTSGNPTFTGTAHTSLQVRSSDLSTVAFMQTVQGTDIRIGGSTNHPVDLYSNGIRRVRITSTGNVGIGTTSPLTRLHVARSTSDNSQRTIYADGTQLSAISTSGTNYLHNVWIENRNFDIDSGVTDSGYRIGLNIEGYHDSNVFEGTLATQKNIWSRNGNNSGGTGTITNSYNLHLETLSGGGITITNNYGLYQTGAGTKNYFEGNVGIGTTSPGYKLQVNGNVDILNVKGSAGNAFVRFTDNDATADFSIGADDGSGAGSGAFILYDRSNSAYRLVVNSSGNVGIGTTSPNAPLEIKVPSSSGALTDAMQIRDSSNYVGIAMYAGAADGEIRVGAAGQLRGKYAAQYAGTRSAHDFHVGANNTNMISFDGSGSTVVVNESGADRDFRVEGLSNQNLIKADAGVDKVAIGVAPNDNTTGTLHVGGNNGGLSVGAANHAGYHIFSQHEGNIPANTTRDVLQFEGPTFARYLKVTVSGYLCQKEVYFFGYQGWNNSTNGNNVGSTVNGTQTFGNGTNSGITVQIECTATSGTSGNPRYKLKIVTGGLSGQLYDTTVVAEFFNPVFYPVYL